MRKRESATWNIRVPEALDKAVNEAVAKNWHYTKTEFIRDAVREKLRKLGINHVEPIENMHILVKHNKEDKNHD
ncbi:MAG: ribbon-helix-helix domain-containing protein [Candidatus Bathyarchaeia archaeon]